MISKTSNKHWNSFYSQNKLTTKPSAFAVFCKNFLKKYINVIYDLGCGNGRDLFYFNKKNFLCIGLDTSKVAINNNKKKFKKYNKNFINKNFCRFFKKNIIKNKFSVYSRFTLHSISYQDQDKLLKNLFLQKNLEYFFIETRTIKDELYGKGKKVGKHEFISTHYRRFIDPKVFKSKLKKYFKIIYFENSKGFAKFYKEDPCVLRVIARKKID